jgi:hypothetical protein
MHHHRMIETPLRKKKMASTNGSVVVGVFDTHDQAQAAVRDLRDARFSEDQIGVAVRDTTRTGETAASDETKAPEGAGAGVAAGAGVGALWALGISAGMLPAIGPVIAGGLLASVLASAAGGAVVGGLAGALVGLGIPESEATRYEEDFKSGRTIVTVRDELRHMEAALILERHGAHNVHHHA